MQSEDDQIFGELDHVVTLVRSFVSETRKVGPRVSAFQSQQVDRVRGGMLNLYDLLELILDDDTLNQEFVFLDFEGEQKMSLLNLGSRWKVKPLESDDSYIKSITEDMISQVADLTGKHPHAIAGLLDMADKLPDMVARKRRIETLFADREPEFYAPLSGYMVDEDRMMYVSSDGSSPTYSLVGQLWPSLPTTADRVFEIFVQWRSERGRYLAGIARRKREAMVAQRKIERLQKEFRLEAA